MLVQRNATDDLAVARELLEQARDAAVAHGYGAVEQRAEAALAQLD
jgi:hypothetical protein